MWIKSIKNKTNGARTGKPSVHASGHKSLIKLFAVISALGNIKSFFEYQKPIHNRVQLMNRLFPYCTISVSLREKAWKLALGLRGEIRGALCLVRCGVVRSTDLPRPPRWSGHNKRITQSNSLYLIQEKACEFRTGMKFETLWEKMKNPNRLIFQSWWHQARTHMGGVYCTWTPQRFPIV